MEFNTLVKALPWPVRGGGGRLLPVWVGGTGTAPGWGGGGTASCEPWAVLVGVGCAKGVAPGTGGAAGCASCLAVVAVIVEHGRVGGDGIRVRPEW